MSAEAALFVRSWRVGKYTAELTMPRPKPGATMHICIEWLPCVPKKLNAAEAQQYRAGRDRALADACRELGINAAVVEV